MFDFGLLEFSFFYHVCKISDQDANVCRLFFKEYQNYYAINHHCAKRHIVWTVVCVIFMIEEIPKYSSFTYQSLNIKIITFIKKKIISISVKTIIFIKKNHSIHSLDNHIHQINHIPHSSDILRHGLTSCKVQYLLSHLGFVFEVTGQFIGGVSVVFFIFVIKKFYKATFT